MFCSPEKNGLNNFPHRLIQWGSPTHDNEFRLRKENSFSEWRAETKTEDVAKSWIFSSVLIWCTGWWASKQSPDQGCSTVVPTSLHIQGQMLHSPALSPLWLHQQKTQQGWEDSGIPGSPSYWKLQPGANQIYMRVESGLVSPGESEQHLFGFSK